MHEHERKRALERRLRGVGASRTQAMAAISRGWRFRHLEDLPPLQYMRKFYDDKFGNSAASDNKRCPAAAEQARPGSRPKMRGTQHATGEKAAGEGVREHRDGHRQRPTRGVR